MTWEYQIFTWSTERSQSGKWRKLNDLGQQGWEAVNITVDDQYIVLLKRRLS
jgi:hypothetical protein